MIKLNYRPLEEKDLEWARELHNDPGVLKMLTDPHHISPVEQEEWFENIQHSPSSKRSVVLLGAEKIGVVRIDNIDPYNNSACIGLDIHRDFRGRGFAAQIYKDIFETMFDKVGLHRLWLLVAEYNDVAIHIYRKVGFREEGRMKEALWRDEGWHDYIIMGILKHEYSTSKVWKP